ncbi:hypothetical protein [Yaniella halotolerans]|uniref:hypothetical protein n=1 Tax=Yaniella halotolerans TaxID=225453 RepID=UPI0003B4EB1D|nr:hypothetical protein [Yaniella halotolerans]
MDKAKPPFDEADDADLLARMQRDPEAIDEVLEELKPLLAADGIDIHDLPNVDPDELHAAMTRAIERHQLEAHTPVGDARTLTVDTIRDISEALYQQQPAQAESMLRSLPLEPTAILPSNTYVTGLTLETLDSIYTNTKLRTALGIVRLPELSDATRAAAQDIQTFAMQGRAFHSRDKMVTTHNTREVGRAAVYLFAATAEAIADHSKLQYPTVVDQLLESNPNASA